MSGSSRRSAWPGSVTQPLTSPIQPSVVYTADGPAALDRVYEGEATGFTYAREGHPNATVLARRIATMEGAGQGLVTGSGMAAVGAVLLGLCRAGDHVIGGNQLYGRSLRMMGEDLPRLGIATSLVDASDASAVKAALRPETRLILIETVSNPTIRIADLAGIAEVARAAGAPLAVDNTFTTPRAVQPLARGADIVIHSVTKLLAGHSDATLGWVGTNDADLMARIEPFAVTMGLTPSPFDCWLAERGLLSFELRYDRAEANAAALAGALRQMHGVARVFYPTDPGHPDAALARPLLGNRGSHMVSFEIEGGRPAAERLVGALAGEIAFAPTLGDISTTLSHPPSSSHRGLSPAARAAIGISDGFFRVSAGCEEAGALIEAFRKGVAAAAG
ncbi:MAG: PLP-dependent transferase [Paracoccaceae bacterium]|nr:PLP-dependent transferase [Paracoccaceae bacterium]